jgi:hypothetical protein
VAEFDLGGVLIHIVRDCPFNKDCPYIRINTVTTSRSNLSGSAQQEQHYHMNLVVAIIVLQEAVFIIGSCLQFTSSFSRTNQVLIYSKLL